MSIRSTIYVSGLQNFVDGTNKFGRALDAQVHRKLVEWINLVREEAEAVVPVRTGYLRSTIYATVTELVATIGASASYAVFVERGTRKMRAQPFIEPSVRKHLGTLENMIVEAIGRAKSEVGFS